MTESVCIVEMFNAYTSYCMTTAGSECHEVDLNVFVKSTVFGAAHVVAEHVITISKRLDTFSGFGFRERGVSALFKLPNTYLMSDSQGTLFLT